MKKLFLLFITLVLFISGCKSGSKSSENSDPQTASLTSFSIKGTDGVIVGSKVTITMPYGTDRSALVADFTHNGKNVVVNNNEQISGKTVNNFNSPLTYTVYSKTGKAHHHTITVNVAASSDKDITTFLINNNKGIITGNKIFVTVPFGTDVTKLVSAFITSGKKVSVKNSEQISKKSTNDFTKPVKYTVTAGDESTKDYTVTVTVAQAHEANITRFAINGVNGKITGNNINLTIPYNMGTMTTSLIADFDSTGKKTEVNHIEQVSQDTVNDFSQPLTYTVIAADGATKNYAVNVAIAKRSDKNFTEFSLDGYNGVIIGTTIVVKVPYQTDVTNMVAAFTTSGDKVTANSKDQISGQTANPFTKPVIYSVIAEDGSNKDYKVSVIVAKNHEKSITKFSLDGHDGVIIGNDIAVEIPYKTDVTNMAATFTTSGVKVNANGKDQISGQTANDFTNPVIYTVTAEDGLTQDYTVTVIVAKNHEKNITKFSLDGHDGVISGNKITVNVPYQTDVTSMIATFNTSGGKVTIAGVEQTSGQTSNNFTAPVVYTVTAEDESTKDYTVSVIIDKSNKKDITEFSLNGFDGVISGNDIDVTVPYQTDVTSMVAAFNTSGDKVTIAGIEQTSGQTSNNFTAPVIYTVTAADGSTKNYTASVTIAKNHEKDITKFSVAGVDASITNKIINAVVPFNTDITNLVATFTTTGTKVTISGKPQTSGVTTNDFSSILYYTVSADDGSTQSYTVWVVKAKSSEKDFLNFSIDGFSGDIQGDNVNVTVPTDTDLSSLVATFTTSGENVIANNKYQVSGYTANDFSNPITYKIVAADDSIKEYQVNVSKAKASEKRFTYFSFLTARDTIISDDMVHVHMPRGSDISKLEARFSFIGDKVTIDGVTQKSAITVNNFTNNVTYTITAPDGSTKNYSVMVLIDNY